MKTTLSNGLELHFYSGENDYYYDVSVRVGRNKLIILLSLMVDSLNNYSYCIGHLSPNDKWAISSYGNSVMVFE